MKKTKSFCLKLQQFLNCRENVYLRFLFQNMATLNNDTQKMKVHEGNTKAIGNKAVEKLFNQIKSCCSVFGRNTRNCIKNCFCYQKFQILLNMTSKEYFQIALVFTLNI